MRQQAREAAALCSRSDGSSEPSLLRPVQCIGKSEPARLYGPNYREFEVSKPGSALRSFDG